MLGMCMWTQMQLEIIRHPETRVLERWKKEDEEDLAGVVKRLSACLAILVASKSRVELFCRVKPVQKQLFV